MSADPELRVPGYSLERKCGVRILRRAAPDAPVAAWRDYSPVVIHPLAGQIMRQVDPDAPAPPADAGIRFAER